MNTATTRYLAPGFVTARVVNPIVAGLTRIGLPVKGSAVLEVAGRSSGLPRATPVNPLRLAGTTYLVAPRGQTDWVKNIRVAGTAALIRGRRRTEIAVIEMADSEKAPVIRAYLKEWAWEVGTFFPGLSADSADADLAEAAPRFPIFRVTSERAA